MCLQEACVVCFERPASLRLGPERYPCAQGCRGRLAVCEECESKLDRCVYCRVAFRRSDPTLGARGEPPFGVIGVVGLIAMMICWMAFLWGTILLGESGRRSRASAVEDANGSPVAVDLDALE